MTASVIVKNLLSQVDQEGNIFLLIDSIIDERTNGKLILQQDTFVITKSGTKQRKIQLKDGKSVSNGRMTVLHEKLKDIKELYPVKMAEYAV